MTIIQPRNKKLQVSENSLAGFESCWRFWYGRDAMPPRPVVCYCCSKFKAENTFFDWTGGKNIFTIIYIQYYCYSKARQYSTHRRRCEAVEDYIFCL